MTINLLIHSIVIFVVIATCMGFLYFFLVRMTLSFTAVDITNRGNRPHLKKDFKHSSNGDKNSEYEGAFIVERMDIDRLRQNKESNGYMIKTAITKDTYEYGYNHFKNVHKGVR